MRRLFKAEWCEKLDMVTLRLLHFCFFAIILATCNAAIAKQPQKPAQHAAAAPSPILPKSVTKVLVVIGYTESSSLIPPIHFNSLSKHLDETIKSALSTMGYTLEDHVWKMPGKEITVLNVNSVCPGESPDDEEVNRWTVCAQQESQIQKTRDYISKHVNVDYDQLIYIGHARQGRGLGLGPNNDTYTVPIENLFVAGQKLKKIVMATCNAESNYGLFIRSKGKTFIGGTEFRVQWQNDLAMVLSELFQLTQN